MLLSFAACVKEDPASIEFKAQEYQMLVGQTKDLMGELEIKNSEAKPVFESSNEAMASVTSEGVVTAHDTGEVTINAMLESVMASCRIRISAVQADTLIINAPQALEVDKERSVTVTVKPAEYNKENLEWAFAPSVPELKYEATKVSAAEYKVKFLNYVDGGKLEVKVSDRNSTMTQTAEIEVIEDGIPATDLSLEMPEKLTATMWAVVKAVVKPAEYDTRHLEWSFVPSSEELDFKYEKVNDLEYNICFSNYVRNGSVTISVTDRISSKVDQNTIKVVELPKEGVAKLSFKLESYKHVGLETFQLDILTEPENYDRYLLEWSSSNEDVATVEAGLVTVLAEGETVIKVKDSISGKEASCAVTVVKESTGVQVKRIDLNKTTLEMRVGEEDVQLVATCYDEEGNEVENYANLEWSAEQIETSQGMVSIVEVTQQGVVTAKNSGSAVVIVNDKSIKTIKAICHVNVSPAAVKVQEVKLTPEAKVIAVGKSFALETVVLPADAENKTIVYSSSDETVATVDASGVVTGVGNGTAYITAKSANGITGECEVTVANAWVEFSSVRSTLLVGEERVLTASVMPENLEGGAMTWSSSAPQVVSVDQNGNIKGLSIGDAEIKVLTSKGIEGTCKVTVMNDYDILLTYNQDITNKGLHQFESFDITVEYTNDYIPENAVWESSDPTALKVTEIDGKAVCEAVYEGKIDRNKDYPVTLTHRIGRKKVDLEIKILPAKPKKVIVHSLPANNTVYLGDSFTFDVTVEPEQAPQDITFWGGLWGSQNWNGHVMTAKKAGGPYSLGFTASGTSVHAEEVYITVLAKPVEGGTLSKTELSLEAGKTAILSVSLIPVANENYDNSLKWSSSNPVVATVQDGVVTAHQVGEAVVTVELSNGDKLTCAVNVVPAIPSDIKVGDYYYSDGSVSSTLDATKKVIGVVFSLNDPTKMGDLKLPSAHPECTHGFVLSTEEYISVYANDRDWGRGDFVSWMNSHGYTQITNKEVMCGYSNTEGINAINAAGVSSYGDVIRVDLYNKVTEHEAKVAAPAYSSGWYLPSYKEMKTLQENYDAINASLAAVNGTPLSKTYTYNWTYSDGSVHTDVKNQQYWHSTFDIDNFSAFDMSEGKNVSASHTADEQKGSSGASATLPVRLVLAF